MAGPYLPPQVRAGRANHRAAILDDVVVGTVAWAGVAKLPVTRSTAAVAQAVVTNFEELTIAGSNLPERHLRDIRRSRIPAEG
jgi:hypothetical protein